MAVLVLTLSASSAATRAEWALVDDEVIIAGGEVGLGEAPDLPANPQPDYAVALAPADAVFLRRAPVPGNNDRDAQRAAPFLIEEQLAQPLEDVEASVGAPNEDGTRLIAAVDAQLLASWRRFAVGLGIKPVHLVPDALALPDVGADLVAFAYADRVLVRTRGVDGADLDGERDVDAALAEPIAIGVDTQIADVVLPLLANQIAPKRVLVSEGLDPNITTPDGTPVALKRVPAVDLRVLAGNISVGCLNALPAVLGAGLVSALDWAGLLRPWRTAGCLAAIALLGTTVFAYGEAAYLDHRAEAYAAAELETFQGAFPDTRPSNPQAQLRRALASVGAVEDSAGFLELAAALAGITADAENVRIDALRYDAARGALTVSALYVDFDDFEALRTAAEARDIILEDGGARQSANGVEGDFTVRLP